MACGEYARRSRVTEHVAGASKQQESSDRLQEDFTEEVFTDMTKANMTEPKETEAST